MQIKKLTSTMRTSLWSFFPTMTTMTTSCLNTAPKYFEYVLMSRPPSVAAVWFSKRVNRTRSGKNVHVVIKFKLDCKSYFIIESSSKLLIKI